MKYEHVLAEVFRKPWAILPEKFAVIKGLVTMRAAGEKLSEEEIRERLSAAASPHAATRSAGKNYGAVAVIPVYGVISQRLSLMSQISGGTSTEKLTASFRTAMADPGVTAIVFDVDSPGGGVEGVPELAAEILAARSQKKIIAVANPMAASAAYWLASAAGELVVTPSGQVGSIGVFCEHDDISQALEREGVKISLISAGRFKTEGNPYEPLSDEARAELQSKVNAFYGMFVKAVASGRRVSQAAVRNGFGEARMVLAADAVKAGMADSVATLDQTISRLSGGAAPRRMAATTSASEIRAENPAALRAENADGCNCVCDPCEADDCQNCNMDGCLDPACADAGCPMQDDSNDPNNSAAKNAASAITKTPTASPASPSPAAAAYVPKSRALLERELELH